MMPDFRKPQPMGIEVIERYCNKCDEPFMSKGNHTCPRCTASNRRVGKRASSDKGGGIRHRGRNTGEASG